MDSLKATKKDFTIILEVVADYEIWIGPGFFGWPGTLNYTTLSNGHPS
jgi:hypothetical protein